MLEHTLITSEAVAGGDGPSFATSSLSAPAADSLVTVHVVNWAMEGAPAAPTGVSGLGMTFTLVDSIALSGGYGQMLSVWRGMTASPTSGVITITAGRDYGMSVTVVQSTGAKTTGTNGAGAIVQSVKGSGSPQTLATLASSQNDALAAWGTYYTTAASAGSGFAELGHSTTAGAASGMVEAQNDVTSVTAGNLGWGNACIALEIAAGGTAKPLYAYAQQ